jgi:hypothetical protein
MKRIIIAALIIGVIFMGACTKSSPTTTHKTSTQIQATTKISTLATSYTTKTSILTTSNTTPPINTGPATSFVLKPSDVGQDWSYGVKLGTVTVGVDHPQYSEYGTRCNLGIERVVMGNNEAIIEEIVQIVNVYPTIEEAINDMKIYQSRPKIQINNWDESYLNTTPGDNNEVTNMAMRKGNCIMKLAYREVLYKKDTITGDYSFGGYHLFDKVKEQQTEDLLRNLAKIVASRQ